MVFKVVGLIGGKKYVSRRSFKTDMDAVRFGYSKTYAKGGNARKKKPLHDWQVVER